MFQQGPASRGLDDVQKAPEVAGVLKPSRLQKVVDGLRTHSQLELKFVAAGLLLLIVFFSMVGYTD